MPMPPRPSTLATALGTAACLLPGSALALKNGNFTGQVFSAYYGYVQVRAVVRGGELANVDVLQYPSDRFTSRVINHRALPQLEREVVAAHDVRVNMVSGATLTSRAFLRSLQSALEKAR